MPPVTLRSRAAKAAAVTTMTVAALTPSALAPAAYADAFIQIFSGTIPDVDSESININFRYSCDANAGFTLVGVQAVVDRGSESTKGLSSGQPVTCDGTVKNVTVQVTNQDSRRPFQVNDYVNVTVRLYPNPNQPGATETRSVTLTQGS